MDIKEIESLKSKLFTDEELKKFLVSVTKELLSSKVKNETLNPVLLTHKEFIDTSLSKLLKKIKQKIFERAKKKGLNLDDKIVEVKLEYLSGYILKYDLIHDKIIHKTIAKHILNIIRKDYLSLNNFVSTLNKEIYQGKTAKFRYPPLYPYDKNRYNNPIPPLKSMLNKIDTINKSLKEKTIKLEDLKNTYEQANLEVTQIKTAASDMKDIIEELKKKYDNPKSRLAMIKNQHSRFNVLLMELKEKLISTKKEIITLTKNIDGIKEKYKDILSKEEEIISEIANNLATMKVKI